MMKSRSINAVFAGAVSISCLVGMGMVKAANNDQPVLVLTEAAIDVDAAGHVSSVEIGDSKLPASLRERAAQVARQWRFQPVLRDGRAVGGRTYARMHVCLVPDGEDLRVAVDYLGNGPGITRPRSPAPPLLPMSELIGRGIGGLEGKRRYRIGADGHATVESATLDDPQLQKRYGDVWLRQQRKWVGETRYKPELVDGVAVSTVLEEDFDITWQPRVRNYTDAMAQLAKQSRACKQAAGFEASPPVAVDSPFKRMPES